MTTEFTSPMKEHVIQQIARINEIISNAQLFKANYQDLTQNIITSLNKQLKGYVKDGRRSIMVDVYNLVLEGINWQELQTKIADMIKGKVNNVPTGEWKKIPKPKFSIEPYDDDATTNMILNCDVEHVKEFQRYRKLAKTQLDDLISNVDEFEQQLCQYRATTVELCLQNVDVLFKHHFNYVNDMLHKKSPSGSVIIDGKEIALKKSQKDFITSALKVLICE